MFNKILIANRGEIAVRLIHAYRGLGVSVVAIYSDADQDAPHTRLADEAYHIGEAPSAQSYLAAERIIQLALETQCEAIHPGYGFLSENAGFAQAVADAGLVFIGPSPDAIRRMGSKTEARQLMQSAGVPVVPGIQGENVDFVTAADEIGYPVLVKAAAGGGGKGMRVVDAPEHLEDALSAARREAQHAFGDATIFLEKYLPISHHIEFQILGDHQGNIVHLFERECSIQRRHQKIIEETPSPLLTDELRNRMGNAAVAAAQAVNYHNAGTIEFIVTPDGDFYFLEMNTRLQVEHPITELVTGIDLAQWQLRIAAGEALPFTQETLQQRGHAIECRVYAEDPANAFLPSVGTLQRVETPSMPNLRIDSGVQTGNTITIHYDPMIAKVISYGTTRAEAIATMQNALQEYVILGVTHNIPFLQAVLGHDQFQTGDTPTNFIPKNLPNWQANPPNDAILDAAWIVAALQEMQGYTTKNANQGTSEQDVHSPWQINDAFRMGGKSNA